MSLVLASGARAATATGVLTGRSDTWDPSAGIDVSNGDTFLAWTLYRRGLPDAFLRINSDTRLQLDRRGIGWAWSIDVPTATAAYQQDWNGNSDLRLYDWGTSVRVDPGAAVNTTRWEYEPALSGQWLVFARLNRAAAPDSRRIILDDLSTSDRRCWPVFRGSPAIGTLESPEINGDWVTWTSMGGRYTRSSVHRYQISTGKSYRIRHPSGRLDYLSSVGPDGTVYFLRSRPGCGNHVSLESYTTAGVLSPLGSMPAGRDGGDEMFAVPQPDGSTSLYFDSYKCTAAKRERQHLPAQRPSRRERRWQHRHRMAACDRQAGRSASPPRSTTAATDRGHVMTRRLTLVALVVVFSAAAGAARAYALTSHPVARPTLARIDRRCFYAPAPAAWWPLSARRSPHPVHAGFNDMHGEDPMYAHWGVDVSTSIVQAKVYAMTSGVIGSLVAAGGNAHFQIGPFFYYHVISRLPAGSHVSRGEWVGHIVQGTDHVHVTEIEPGCGIVDPRRPTGPLADPKNTEHPTVENLSADVANAPRIASSRPGGRRIQPSRSP